MIRKKNPGIICILMAVLFALTIGFAPSYAKGLRVSKPQLIMVTQPKAEYQPGERVSFQVKSPNYNGKVQYRVILWNGTTKKQSELWASIPGYYYNKWMPAGTQTFTIGWPIMEPGAYSITVLVKRAGAKATYDSFIKTESFVVKTKSVTLDKEGMIYGSQNVSGTENIYGDVNIAADNTTLRNVNVSGTVIINPGKDGSANLENVTAENIKVLSGGENSIHLKNVFSKNLTVSSDSRVRVESYGATRIDNTTVTSYAVLDVSEGSLGTIRIEKNSNSKYDVEFRGTFTEPVIIETDVNIKSSASIEKLQISPENKDANISIHGTYKNIEILNDTNLSVDGSVSNIELKANANISTTSAANIANINKNNYSANITGSGVVGQQDAQSSSTPSPTVPPAAGGGGVSPGGTAVSAPNIEAASAVLSNGSTRAATREGSSNTFSIDLSDLGDGIGVKTSFTTDSDCELVYNGSSFNMKAHTSKSFGPADFGMTDNDPPGISMASMRDLTDKNSEYITQTITLKNDSNSSVQFTLKIKVRNLNK